MRVAALALTLLAQASAAQVSEPVGPARASELVRTVRQDCGACHGLKLTGGLGPALTREALADKPVDSMAATILHGRPGTPMPPWKTFLSPAEARWLAEQLRDGLPAEAK